LGETYGEYPLFYYFSRTLVIKYENGSKDVFGGQPVPVIQKQTKTVSDTGNLYTVEIPADWIHSSSANVLVSIMFIVDPNNPNEMLSVSATKVPFNLSSSYKTNKDALKSYKKFKVLEEGTGKISDQDCMWFICTWTTKEGDAMKGKQYTIKHNGRDYCIQYHVKESHFDRIKEPFEKIIFTLTFTK
jgi:hypothetical protein